MSQVPSSKCDQARQRVKQREYTIERCDTGDSEGTIHEHTSIKDSPNMNGSVIEYVEEEASKLDPALPTARSFYNGSGHCTRHWLSPSQSRGYGNSCGLSRG